MSKTLRELTDSAEASGDWDAVADWCEGFKWAQAEGLPAVEFYLEVAAAAADGAAGRSGRADVSERIEEILASEVPSSH